VVDTWLEDVSKSTFFFRDRQRFSFRRSSSVDVISDMKRER
jgi:hypothetical protein